MLGRVGAYVVGRVAGRAADAVERQVVWGGLGGVLLLAALVFGLLFLFIWLQAEFGPQSAALIVAAICAVGGLIFMQIPSFLDSLERSQEENKDSVEEVVETVDEEAKAAVDYLGPLQVTASAFMLGYAAARQFKKR
jgi:predicted membrane-bound spermidine synthase